MSSSEDEQCGRYSHKNKRAKHEHKRTKHGHSPDKNRSSRKDRSRRSRSRDKALRGNSTSSDKSMDGKTYYKSGCGDRSRSRNRSKSGDRLRFRNRSKSRDRSRSGDRSRFRNRSKSRDRSRSRVFKSDGSPSKDRKRRQATCDRKQYRSRSRDRQRDRSTSRDSQIDVLMSTEEKSESKNIQREISGFRARRVSSDRDSSKSKSPDRSCQEPDTCETNPGGSDEEVPDYDIDWENYRRTLTKIFFRDEDYIKRGTEEYHIFWDFLKKCLAFKRKKASEPSKGKPKSSVSKTEHSDKETPGVNKMMSQQDIANLLRGERYRPGVEPLTEKRVQQLKEIYIRFLDFLQKQKSSKIVKIRTDQQNLPIFAYKAAIVDAVQQHQVVIVAGDTGCGKSTQVPQYLLEAGFQQVACTQPRRIACISLAKRVAHETLNEYGSQVAYQVRFEKTKSAVTKILFLTEGLLLRQITNDTLLEKYNVIVIDEVHERHIHTDFLLGVMKCLLQQRADLKLVLMSATININLFSDYFDKAPVVKVPGRLYPIQLEYLPISEEEKGGKTQRLDPGPYVRVLQRIEHKYPLTERGDVLMFLSGMTEIMTIVEAIQAYAEQSKRWIVLPLHSALSVAEQDKVFDFPPDGVRKCIVSTNIAETSVTIDGVRFVVDSGKVKEMSYDTQFKMQRLQEFWISRASSEQRKGRSGRTGPGVCYRLYAEADYTALQPYSTPEIHRVPLNALVLQMVSMGLNDARRFPFIEPPSADSLENAIYFLIEQNALTNDEVLTPVGQMLSQLPVDVVIGKMLIMGSLFHMTEPVLSTASALSVQSPFTAKAHSDSDLMNARKPLESDHGDPFTLLNALDEWVQVKADSRNNSRKWCRRRGLEEQRFYEMTRLKTQFHGILKDHGLLAARVQGRPAGTSYERQKQHAERRRLNEMKRDQRRTRHKRKILKMDDEFNISGDDDNDDEADLDANIRDLEFRLTHDLDEMQDRSNESRGFTLRQTTLLKIILCSGLYPQVALADDCQGSQSEPMYHTKSKPFVTLHPTSIFSTNDEVLELHEADIRPPPGGATDSDRRYPFSNKHQLLAYVTLLETTKPYLTGVMRVPALQTLALYATAIDTNSDCTRLVFDGWLDVRFGQGEEATAAGELVLSACVQLRTTWQLLVQAKLDAHTAEEGDTTLADNVRQLERTLANKLTEFLYCDVIYSIRRLLAADLNTLYIGAAPEGENETSAGRLVAGLCKEATPHPTKGGLKVNDYLTFNCLQDRCDAYTSYMQRHWTCSECGEELVVTVIERIRHEQECALRQCDVQETAETEEGLGPKNDGKDSLRKVYHCPKCDKDLKLTISEILKHKKQCTTSSSSEETVHKL